jgi:hypothetical protein
MSTIATITHICRIAEAYAQTIGLAEFEIERIVHSRTAERDEWILHLEFKEVDPLIEHEGQGAIIVVDSATENPQLIEGL